MNPCGIHVGVYLHVHVFYESVFIFYYRFKSVSRSTRLFSVDQYCSSVGLLLKIMQVSLPTTHIFYAHSTLQKFCTQMRTYCRINYLIKLADFIQNYTIF